MKKILVFLCAFATNLQLIGQDTISLIYDAPPIDIKIQVKPIAEAIQIERKDFLYTPGAFDDPSRLLIRYPGVSTTNDQSNFVLYRGQPAHHHKWQLYGADVLNPNHLSNAGTGSDLPNRSAGGVNMLSGQVLNTLNFLNGTNPENRHVIGGISNLSLKNPIRNRVTTNLSLIGMEAGVEHMINEDEYILSNFRYSTVGLLTKAGVDFGGEAINYQDATISYGKRFENGGQFKAYAVIGSDQNTKNANDEAETIKDLKTVDFESSTGLFGIHYNNGGQKYNVQTTLNYSRKDITRTDQINPDTLNFINYQSNYSSNDQLLSHAFNLKTQNRNTTYGFGWLANYYDYNYNNEFPTIGSEKTSIAFDQNIFHFIPYLSLHHKFSDIWSIQSNVGVQFNNASEKWQPTAGASLQYDGTIKSKLSYSFQSQLYEPEQMALFGIDYLKSQQLEWSVAYRRTGIQFFYNTFSNLPGVSNMFFLSPFENLDFLFNPASSQNFKGALNGVSLYSGLSLSQWNLDGSITYLNGTQTVDDQELSMPYAARFQINASIGKQWNFNENKTLGMGVASHYRSGFDASIPLTAPEIIGTIYDGRQPYTTILGDYFRTDLRIFYIIKRKRRVSTLSLDIQNITSRLNDGFLSFDPLLQQSTITAQLGMIPILSWRLDFGY